MEFVNSEIRYEIGAFLEDDVTKQIFEVKKCSKHLLYENQYMVELKEVEQNKQLMYLENLKDALKGVKMHDKDLFMLENIVSQIEDTLK